MSKYKYIIIIIAFGVQYSITAQQVRTSSMGGLSYGIADRDFSLSLFDFGANPAWLVNDELSDRLEISPSISNNWGNYRRTYSPDGTSNYNVGFIGIKPLGKSGTFRGMADYNYALRRKNYRTLKKDTYAGEAFYFTDTTSGDFRYSGPTFEIMHSLPLFDDLFIGAAAEYQIIDGLKQVYTFAQTLYRNVSGKFGLAYSVAENFHIGATFHIFDSQERIEANDVNLLTVQTYHYRGEKHAVLLSGTTQDYKLQKDGTAFGGQIYWGASETMEMAMTGSYSYSRTVTLFPVSLIIDNEDGYSYFNRTDLSARMQYKPSSSWLFGILFQYSANNSWSKNTQRDLLLWKWDVNQFSAGLGASYYFDKIKLLTGAEYEYTQLKSDSLKYVDNEFNDFNSMNHKIRVGGELNLSDVITLRGGYILEFYEFDLIFGGEDVIKNKITAGTRIEIDENISIEGQFEYLFVSDNSGASRQSKGWESLVTLTFYSF